MSSLRPVTITRGFTRMSSGSVLYRAGGTVVLCTASVEPKIPEWMKGKGKNLRVIKRAYDSESAFITF